MIELKPIKLRQVVATYGRRPHTVTVISLVRRRERVAVVFWREHGQRREQTIDGRTRREAESAAKAFAEQKAAVLQSRASGLLAMLPAAITLADLREKYLLAKGLAWAPATRRNNDARWKKFVTFAGQRTKAADVTLETIDEWRAFLRQMGHEPSEIARMLTGVKAVYRFGIERDYVASKIPMYSPERLPGDKPRRIKEFTPPEVRTLLAELKPRGRKVGRSGVLRPWRVWSVCWMTAASAKRTRSQMLPLRWTDVHFRRGGAEIEWPAEHDKLKKEHLQPMPRRAAAMLRLVRWLARSEGVTSAFVWPARRDKESRRQLKHMGYAGLVHQLHLACGRCGVPHRQGRAMHGFRRYAANTVLASGGNIKDAGLWLNDTDLKTLSDSYLRERDGEQLAIAERMPSPDGRVRRTAQSKGTNAASAVAVGATTDGPTTDEPVDAGWFTEPSV